jgi:type I restriction enzyme, S subunit
MPQQHNTTRTPALRFPEFTGEWEVRKLGEVGEVKMCRRIFNEETSPSGEIPFKIGSFGKLPDAFISKELYLDYRKRFSFPKKGDILISAAGTIGRTVIYNGEDAYYQDSNIVWIDNDSLMISNEFLFYILQMVKYNTEGGTIQRLYNGILKSIQFSHPTLPEQTKIANFLTAVDERLQALKNKKRLLEQWKKGLMQQIFSQELRFKDENGGDFGDWEVKKLGEVTYKVDKKNKHKENLPVYSINNKEGFVPQSEQFEGVDSNERGYDTSLYKVIEENTFAYNPARINVGSIGYSGNIGRVIVSSLYVCFKTNDNIYDPFFSYYLQTPFFNKEVLKNAEGGVRDYLFYENFSIIPISFPTLPEQKKIAAFLSGVDERIGRVSEQIAAMERYKKGLLQGMFV